MFQISRLPGGRHSEIVPIGASQQEEDRSSVWVTSGSVAARTTMLARSDHNPGIRTPQRTSRPTTKVAVGTPNGRGRVGQRSRWGTKTVAVGLAGVAMRGKCRGKAGRCLWWGDGEGRGASGRKCCVQPERAAWWRWALVAADSTCLASTSSLFTMRRPMTTLYSKYRSLPTAGLLCNARPFWGRREVLLGTAADHFGGRLRVLPVATRSTTTTSWLNELRAVKGRRERLRG